MSNASLELLVFAVLAACLYNLRSSLAWRQATLLGANLLFLASFSLMPLTWAPLAAFLALGYLGVRLLQSGARGTFWPLLSVTIAVFVWLKKYTFLPEAMFLRPSYTVIGLSYMFFRVLHLLIDIRGGQLLDRIGLASYLNYILNFTTLVSGPIQRYQDFAATHLRIPRPRLDIFMIGRAGERVVQGFFKVTVLSTILSYLHDQAINVLSPAQPFISSALTAAFIAASYPIYLYCNFSGYMDIVIGLAKLLRFDLPENFDRPFSAQNFIDFWNRWHITLSSWLKMYVYNPLLILLMRRLPSANAAPFLGVIAYFVTFLLIGIWHGQTSEFVVYGVVLGLGVGGNKLFQVVTAKILGRERSRSLQASALYNAFARGLTFTWFTFSLVFFWSNWTQIETMLERLSHGAFVTLWFLIFAAATLILAAYEASRNWVVQTVRQYSPILSTRYARVMYCTALAALCLVTAVLVNLPPQKIVYKAF